MKEFDYSLNYSRIKFKKNDKRYRIGRGEQGVLLVRPYKDDLVKLWKFKTPVEAEISAKKIYKKFLEYRDDEDFIGMDMSRKFLEMGFTRSRRYANHPTGKKYSKDGTVLPKMEEKEKAKSAKIFKEYRDMVASDKTYQTWRKWWRSQE